MGKFVDAGKVYAEAAQLFESKFILNLNAGLAFKRGDDCERSELRYVMAMRHVTDDEEDKYLLFQNMHENYKKWFQLNANNSINEVMVAFSAMVLKAGWKIDRDRGWTRLLKDEYTIRRNARTRINEILVTCDDVKGFRESILSCLKNRQFLVCNTGKTESQAEMKARAKRRSKDIARMDTSSPSYRCGNCDTMVKKKKQCPCGTITYCSEECQRAHWKNHKLTCTAVRKTK